MSGVKCALPEGASDLLKLMGQAASEAAATLVRQFDQSHNLMVTEKAAGDFVSQADLQSEIAIKEVLQAAFPGYGWLGEETKRFDGDGDGDGDGERGCLIGLCRLPWSKMAT